MTTSKLFMVINFFTAISILNLSLHVTMSRITIILFSTSYSINDANQELKVMLEKLRTIDGSGKHRWVI